MEEEWSNVIDASNTVDIGNSRLVSLDAGHGTVRVLNPPTHPMTPTDALVFAAWLVTMAEIQAPTGISFERILERVRST
jgi:hypothetical protein